jgi:hypothetical protein
MTDLISLAAFVVALFALIINEEKFRLDLYNKRFDIYQRTVQFYQAFANDKFYQAAIKPQEPGTAGIFDKLQSDFIIASRESRFLFAPDSGIYDLLLRLNRASLEATLILHLTKAEAAEEKKEYKKTFHEAVELWTSGMRQLEDLMAPYLNYHYNSAFSALIGWLCRLPGRLFRTKKA